MAINGDLFAQVLKGALGSVAGGLEQRRLEDVRSQEQATGYQANLIQAMEEARLRKQLEEEKAKNAQVLQEQKDKASMARTKRRGKQKARAARKGYQEKRKEFNRKASAERSEEIRGVLGNTQKAARMTDAYIDGLPPNLQEIARAARDEARAYQKQRDQNKAQIQAQYRRPPAEIDRVSRQEFMMRWDSFKNDVISRPETAITLGFRGDWASDPEAVARLERMAADHAARAFGYKVEDFPPNAFVPGSPVETYRNMRDFARIMDRSK